ncbi:CAAX amino terminal protease family protein [Plesiocystis pacifica SIR-1]|uniref:CAAX amino terminal protease family protein n=1 Tax=Plesiocystis pacifica SIR-1 TaxID=391625 RepID=A6GG56_9BACT|nr:MrtZ family glutamic-type intramembrane protease [Plesiocystis pacifica]EDM75125.1 CAAX amino terminal protease family protein [Plesiocystis pacifica SIR-1]
MSASDTEAAEPASTEAVELSPEQARRVARRAVLATVGLYLGYGLIRQLPWPPVIAESIGLLLIAGFFLLPGWMLRDRPDLAARWQVGPDSPIPPWRRSGWRLALIAGALIFPVFAVGTWLFYWRVCQGDLTLLAPVIAVESWTPGAGGLERFFARQCRLHPGGLWPRGIYVPSEWAQYYGLGFLRAVAVGLFAVALPEEVFHRGYLMSALEQRFPPKREVLGVPFGWAAVISSALFALGHLVTVANTARLGTFFPALVFAWLWRRSDSLWAPALFHVASNLLMDMLLASTFPPL